MKSLVFFPLLWFRGIFRWLLIVIGGITGLFGILVIIGGVWSSALLFLAISFVCIALRVGYAVLLVKLNPTDTGMFTEI